MRTLIGNFFKGISVIILLVSGLWSFMIELYIINLVWGLIGLIVGFFIAPVTFLLAPWYVLFAWGNWNPLILGYGGIIVYLILNSVGKLIKPSEYEPFY